MADTTHPAFANNGDQTTSDQQVPNQVTSREETAQTGIKGPPPSTLAGVTDAQPATTHDIHAQTLAPARQDTNFLGEGVMNSPLSGMVVPAVLCVLIFFSVVTWASLLIKGIQFARFRQQNQRFALLFWRSANLSEGRNVALQSRGSLARLAQVGIDVVCGNDITSRQPRELSQQINRGERLERSLRQQIQRERRSLENGLVIVASIGSTAPFIGLFGTVWGIMEALVRIGITGEAGLNSVAGPIGHALIATGIGIAAAVPAVLIYNYFVRRFKLAVGDMEAFAEEFYSLAQETAFSDELNINGSGI